MALAGPGQAAPQVTRLVTLTDGSTQHGPEEVARPAHHDHQVHHDRGADRKRRRLDELHQAGEQGAGDAGIDRADGKAQQGVAAGVHAQAFGPDGVVAQRREGLAPGAAQQAPQQRGQQGRDAQHQVVVGHVAFQAEAEQAGPGDVVDAEGAAGEPFLVAHHQPDGGVEAQGGEGQVDGLHPQGRKAQDDADHEADQHGRGQAQPEAQARPGGEDGHGVGPDGVEAHVPERHLPRQPQQHVQPDAHQREQQFRQRLDEVQAKPRHLPGKLNAVTALGHVRHRAALKIAIVEARQFGQQRHPHEGIKCH